MPLFDHECNECGVVYEHIHMWSDYFPTCPKCSSRNSKKILSAPIIRIGDEWDGIRSRTGCKGFELDNGNGQKIPLYSKYR